MPRVRPRLSPRELAIWRWTMPCHSRWPPSEPSYRFVGGLTTMSTCSPAPTRRFAMGEGRMRL